MKAWLAAVLAAGFCIGCAQRSSAPTPRTNDGSSITMYGTIDQGITVRK